MRVIANIEGQDIVEYDNGSVVWLAKMAVDSDGTGPHHGDHTAQDETTYKPNLNADLDKYIVVPPAIRDGVAGIVMGCQAHVVCRGNNTAAVVGDIGPHKKLGEASCSTASAVGLNPSPVSGGIDTQIVTYTIWPGVAALVDGKQYKLQPK